MDISANIGRQAPAGTNAASNRARDVLARTTRAVQAVQQMESAAHAAAVRAPSKVPNGLGVGGLQVAPGVPANLRHPAAGENASLWTGANLPVQSTGRGKTVVTIEQTTPQAVLHWQTFNVGRQTEVDFDQSAGGNKASQWIAFNLVSDPSGVPSQILGSLHAQGQVYLINANGILFGGSSQINLHGLLASSLQLNTNLLAGGLLNNPDGQFLFSSLAQTAGSNGTPAFAPTPPATPGGANGDVVVEAGATIEAPTSAAHVGGRVMLIGPAVSNAGTIATPDGQTIIAAGKQVGFAAHARTDPSLRGLDVFVGAATGATGTVSNTGLIEADRGDITLAGRSIEQLAVLGSTTSVSLNGRIDLDANYQAVTNLSFTASKVAGAPPFLSQAAGTVTLGTGSVTQIVPELASSETLTRETLALPSQVNLQGNVIHLATNAIVYAPNALANLHAGTWSYTAPGNIPQSVFVYSSGQITLDPGSVIELAGSQDVSAPIAQNILTVQLRAAELANDPLQRDGILRGVTLQIDARVAGLFQGQSWVGTPLADLSSYVALIERTVGEQTIDGGSLSLTAGGSVLTRASSSIDVSGGWINYQGGMVQTSRVALDGHVLDISQVTPDQLYGGLYTGTSTATNAKFGLSTTYANPLRLSGRHFEQGYLFGGDGGSVSITAPSMSLAGQMVGQTESGPRQRSVPAKPSSLSLAFQAQSNVAPFYLPTSPTPPRIVFEQGMEAGAPGTMILSPDLLGPDGFGSLALNDSDGDILVPAQTSLIALAGGAIFLDGANLTIAGTLSAPAGQIALTAHNVSPSLLAALKTQAAPKNPATVQGRGTVLVAGTASISTAGLIVDDRPGARDALTAPLLTMGGSISVAGLSVDLESGSSLDVSGGVNATPAGKIAYGAAGSLSIKAGQDPLLPSVLGGDIALGAKMSGFGGTTGGSLTLQAPALQIAGAQAAAGTTLLAPEFLQQGGWSNFALSGISTVRIAAQADLEPVAQSWVATLAAPGTNGLGLAVMLEPEGVRPAANLSLTATGARDSFSPAALPLVRGEFVMEAGAQIRTDAQASVSIQGDTANLQGSIIVPGGAISITGASDSGAVFANQNVPLVTVLLGPESLLSTAGIRLLTPDPRALGRRTGSVLPGGSIFVAGNILAQNGSVLDVSGARGMLDLLPGFSEVNAPAAGSFLGAPAVPTMVESDAGSISLAGGQELITQATLLGNRGGVTALGGTLSVESGRFFLPGSATPTPLDATLQVTQTGPSLASAGAVGRAVLSESGHALPGLGYFGAQSFLGGGFDSLTLGGVVQFAGPVSIAARGSLTVADAGVIMADAPVHLSAGYLKLGQPFLPPLPPNQQPPSAFTVDGQPFYVPPTFGAGSLTLEAGLIDVGNLSLRNIGAVCLNAAQGDVRGDGGLDVAGSISITAGQIYPPTEVSFTISASDYMSHGKKQSGSIVIEGGGAQELPLSADGTLNLYATNILQGGALRVPFGTINLGWTGSGTAPVDPVSGQAVASARGVTLGRGSVTSVSAIDPMNGQSTLIPYGIDANGKSWIDPSGLDITLAGAPAKGVNISAQNVDDQAGAMLDLRGGGDLYAYRWFSGLQGTVDILASSGSFAVLPGYQADYAPFAPYNPTPTSNTLAGDAGYVNSGLVAGDRIYLGASPGLPAGFYTLLPARYALLPGAQLVTPKLNAPIGTVAQPDGSTLVSGYRINSLDPTRHGETLLGAFEVASQAVVRARAEYDNAFASQFLSPVSSPNDGGHLIFQATQSLELRGSPLAQAATSGQAGQVDISSATNILIVGANAGPAAPGTLVLSAAELDGFGAGSLLIGGIRSGRAGEATVTVATGSIAVENAGTPLVGADLTLVANQGITLAPGAAIESSGQEVAAQTLILGAKGSAVSGDGVLLRVSSDPSAGIARLAVDGNAAPQLTLGAGARVVGAGVILDSTAGTSLNPAATLAAEQLTLDSGRISLVLDPGANPPAASGLVLSPTALAQLAPAGGALSLLSYSSLDFYGSGKAGSSATALLGLHAAEVRSFDAEGGPVVVAAQTIAIDNQAGDAPVDPAAPPGTGSLRLEAGTISIGENIVSISGFSQVDMAAANGVAVSGTGGLATDGALTISSPKILGTAGANGSFSAGGALLIKGGSSRAAANSGLGVTLSFTGASVTDQSSFILPSGNLTLHATIGDVVIDAASLDASGSARRFFDVLEFTNGGQIQLVADQGEIQVATGTTLSVDAVHGGGNAGAISISVPEGTFVDNGTLSGRGGGSFSLDTGSLSGSALSDLSQSLRAGGFTASQSFRVRNGDVTLSTAAAHAFTLSVDNGSILVTGKIDASGTTGGTIDLSAAGNLTLASGAMLTVAGQDFDTAGQGGSVALEVVGVASSIDLQDGSTIDLTVTAPGGLGKTSGTLQLRAPQAAGGSDLGIAELGASFVGASRITVVGSFTQDANAPNGAAIDNFEGTALANANAFMAHAGSIQTRLVLGDAAWAALFHVEPGEEIVNSAGSLTLNQDWDLSTWRFGPQKPVVTSSGQTIVTGTEPGLLTLRAKGSIIFHGSLSDGFGNGLGAAGIPKTSTGAPAAWREPLLPLFTDGSAQASWSYRITSGADFSAASVRELLPLSGLAAGAGSILLGVDGGTNISVPFGTRAQVDSALHGHFQVIRTGAGSIEIGSGRDLELLNQFATIYTAGALVSDPTLGGAFDTPILSYVGGQTSLGPIQETTPYPVQYSLGGGNVSIIAQEDIFHATLNSVGQLIPDSGRELPVNWLYCRGDVTAEGESAIGEFGDRESTSWWIDFSNFFEGVGALGGGNVTLEAGRDITNVDAVIPTNARMPAGTLGAASLVELGGGDLRVQAGRDLSGGAYYVERGRGLLAAGRDVLTNATRAPFPTNIVSSATVYGPDTWLPTTLFLGEGSFAVSAGRDLLLGPVANPFLLPEGYSNSFWYKTYFSTYGSTDRVEVASLTGGVTLREATTLPTSGAGTSVPVLESWLQNVLLYSPVRTTASFYQPWLRLDETDVSSFTTVSTLLPSTWEVSAFSGSISLDGRLNLFPSATGSLSLLAAGAINGLQIQGVTILNGVATNAWAAATIDVSDADPATVPGITTPFAYQSVVGLNLALARQTGTQLLTAIDDLFAETGATSGTESVQQVQQALHARGPLHANDPSPVLLYAVSGDISGLTLFTGQPTRILAGRDVTDLGAYLGNVRMSDISIVSAGRDIVAYDPSSPLRSAAQQPGSNLDLGGLPQTGDIQISGPGTLEVLAGRNLDLGVGPSNSDGTALGITSVGNARNPFLPDAGADIVALAGIAGGRIGFGGFARLLADSVQESTLLGELDSLSIAPAVHSIQALNALPANQQEIVLLDLFFLQLRDEGRGRADATGIVSTDFSAAFAAIQALFGAVPGPGDISLTSREIKTTNGGNIALLTPAGKIEVGVDLASNQSFDQGILTEDGGNISIFAHGNVDLGTSRVFTLRDGNIIIWSSTGDIAAGASSKTVLVAPPTRVIIDPGSADTRTDLAGLATGGGIGVLESVAGVPAGNVDLIAPAGTIDAGDAGIRASGNLTLSAVRVLNGDNIQADGTVVGLPSPVTISVNLAALAAGAQASGALTTPAILVPPPPPPEIIPPEQTIPSIITVEVTGAGEGDPDASADP